MGKCVFAICLLLSILAGCLGITALVDKHTNQAVSYIEAANNAAKQKDFTRALEFCESTISYWKDHNTLLSSFLRHEDSGAIELGLQQLKAFAESESAESFHATCAELVAQMEHIKENERPLLRNVL